MAQLGRLEFTILNDEGQPTSGAVIEVRKQGAQVRGTTGASPYTVDDVGAVATGATVKLYLLSSKTETSGASATINSSSSIGTAPNLGGANDDDRLTITSPLPLIYEDAQGATTTSNPLGSDSTGYASCYAEGGYYDVKVSGTGLTARLYVDVLCNGAKTTAYMFDAGTAVGFRHNIVSAATGGAVGVAGAVITEFANNGVRKAAIDKDGDLIATDVHAANIDTTGTLAVGTSATIGTTLGVTGATTVAALTASGLITGSAGITISAGAVTVPAGSIAVAALASGVTQVDSKTFSGSMALSTTPTTITGLSSSFTITSTNSTVLILGHATFDGTGTGGAIRYGSIGLYDGAALLGTAVGQPANSTSAAASSACLFHIVTGTSGAKTYTLKGSQNAGTDVNATSGRLFVIEFKK